MSHLNRSVLVLLMTLAGTGCAHEPGSSTAAKELFGRSRTAAPLEPDPIGFYSRGCLAGARQLPIDGRNWQVMRLSRNRNWGHPELIEFLKRFSAAAAKDSGWPGILVGDLSQPRGGPMLTGHVSHQIGLDADIWLTPMPGRVLTREEREQVSAVGMVRGDRLDIDRGAWTDRHVAVLRAAAMDPGVQRIFVNPAIKRALCRAAGGEPWLGKMRPERGHDSHFHVRMFCPRGSTCTDQESTPPGDSCDDTLEWWFTDEALHPPESPPRPPITMANLPERCREVLLAQ